MTKEDAEQAAVTRFHSDENIHRYLAEQGITQTNEQTTVILMAVQLMLRTSGAVTTAETVGTLNSFHDADRVLNLINHRALAAFYLLTQEESKKRVEKDLQKQKD